MSITLAVGETHYLPNTCSVALPHVWTTYHYMKVKLCCTRAHSVQKLNDDSHFSEVPTLYILLEFVKEWIHWTNCTVQALNHFHHLHSGWAALARCTLRPGILEAVGILELVGEGLELVDFADLFRAAVMTAVRMVLAVAEDGLWVVRGWEGTWASEFGASRLVTRRGDPLIKAGVPSESFSGTDLSDDLRVNVSLPWVCVSLTVLSRVLKLRFTSAWTAAGRATGEERIDMLRELASRLATDGLVGTGTPLEDSVLERTLGMPVLLEGKVRETSPRLAPIPLRTGIFIVRDSSFDVGDAASRRSTSLSFLHLEQRLGAGRTSGEVGGDKVS